MPGNLGRSGPDRGRSARPRRYSLLFVSLLGLMVIPPFLGKSTIASWAVGAMVTVLLLGVLLAASSRRIVFRFALVLVVPPLLVNILSAARPESEALGQLRGAVVAGFLALAAASILADVLGPGEVDFERILGALCVYLLFGLVWGFLFALVDSPVGTGLSMPQPLQAEGGGVLSSYIYFSFVTLTTLGYGDVLPISAPAKGLAIVEAVLGPIYLAVLVARLVALYVGRR